MWTCIVRVTGIMSMTSEGEGIQHACGQFEHAIDSVNLALVKRKEKKRGKHGFRSSSCSNKIRDSPKCCVMCSSNHGVVATADGLRGRREPCFT